MNRTPAYLRPAGQAVTIYPLPTGLSVQGFNAAMQPVMAAGLNAANQLVDATGALVLDASSRPISNPVSNAPVGTTPPATSTATPAVVPPQPVATTPVKRGYGLMGILVTAAVIGGAAYVGSYYGAKRATRA